MKSLPVSAPHELAEVRIQDMIGAPGFFISNYHAVTNPIWEQIRDRQQTFSGVLAWGTEDFNLAQGGEVRLAKGPGSVATISMSWVWNRSWAVLLPLLTTPDDARRLG